MLTLMQGLDPRIYARAILQAWTMTYALYKGRPTVINNVLQGGGAETIAYETTDKIGNFDGGLMVLKSGPNVFVVMGTASGLADYAAWLALGVDCVALADVNAWVNTLWAGYEIDVKGRVLSTVQANLGPGGTVQIMGYSQGGAMARYMARMLRVNGVAAPLQIVTFGSPRDLGNGAPGLLGYQEFILTNEADPIPWEPLPGNINVRGGTLGALPVPAVWADNLPVWRMNDDGTITVLDNAQDPGIAFFNHATAQYTVAVAAVLANVIATNGPVADVDSWVLLLQQILNDAEIVVFTPQPVKPLAPPAPQAPAVTPNQVAAQNGRQLITPFYQPGQRPGDFGLPDTIGKDPW